MTRQDSVVTVLLGLMMLALAGRAAWTFAVELTWRQQVSLGLLIVTLTALILGTWAVTGRRGR